MTKPRLSNFRSLLFLLAVGVGCGTSSAQEPTRESAELVLRGGRVHAMDPLRTRAEALAIASGRIVFVGDDPGAGAFIGPETRVLELDGRMVLPGFHDSHVHPVTGGIELGQCDLNGLATREAVLDKVADCAAKAEPGAWLVGGGWDLTLFPAANPTSAELDPVVSDRPVYLSSADGHSAWVNGEALERARLDRDTPDPVNGRIERDQNGNPTGTLRESAMRLVSRHLPELTLEDRVAGLRRALAMANRFGITSLVEASASEEVLAAYESLARSGELSARVRISLHVDEDEEDAGQIARLETLRARAAAAGVRADAAKIFADGVIEAHTAALLDPYVGPGHAGGLNFAPERLERLVAELDAAGFQVHIHAIGDRAIRASLDAIEHARDINGTRDARHQLAHVQLFDPEDIPRFAELGVIADFQPLWAYADTYITDLTEPVLGEERSRWLYPIRSLAESGAPLAAGSDWSVSSMDPLDAIQVAVTRRALDAGAGEPAWIPEERVDLDTILAAYTSGGAWVQHQESSTGSLEIGKAADLIVLQHDLFEIPHEAIHDVEVVLTLLGGRQVYRSESFTN